MSLRSRKAYESWRIKVLSLIRRAQEKGTWDWRTIERIDYVKRTWNVRKRRNPKRIIMKGIWR